MTQSHEGFVALQVRFNGCATVTISKDNPAEIKADLLALGLSEVEAQQILDDAGQRFLAAIGQGPVDASEGIANVKKPVSQGGLGGKEVVETGPKCGHGVPRVLRNGSKGKFWSCVAKDENGDFLWKKKEGCKILDYEEGLKQLNGNA